MNVKAHKWKLIGLTSVIVAILIVVFLLTQIGPYDKNSQNDVLVEIPSGSSVSKISNILHENKLIRNKTLFKIVVKLSYKGQSVKAGKYLLNQNYSNNKILDILVSGKIYNDGIKVTFPEGSTSKEMIEILVKNNLGDKVEYEKLIKNPSLFYDEFKFLKKDDIVSLEGFLYPNTYYFEKDTTEKETLSFMLSHFDKIYNDKFKKRQEELDLTLQQVVNLASIVEKEAILDKDRSVIASVFYNRIDIGMPLQSDATLQYAFEERKKIVTYNDLKLDSPYNSYKNNGLPPTPISNPGVKSIEATLYPDNTNYLYFVAKVDGSNNYSESYEDHLKYSKEYKEERDKLK